MFLIYTNLYLYINTMIYRVSLSIKTVNIYYVNFGMAQPTVKSMAQPSSEVVPMDI